MKRRAFIAALSGAAAWPLVARGQQPKMPVVGSLYSGTPETWEFFAPSFRQGLKDGGYIEGQNVVIEYRWGRGEYDRLPALAADLAERRVDVITANGGEPAALAAKAATSTIPIVFGIGGDPVKLGLVSSLNRPGGNATGISLLTPGLDRKRIELLHELLPTASVIAALVNPKNQLAEMQANEIQEAARITGNRLLVLNASSDKELEAAFNVLHGASADALVVTADPFFLDMRSQLAALAARYGVPAVYGFREFAKAGGLLSYGSSPADGLSTIGRYTARILGGAHPADLPVWQAVKIELVLNLKTAKTLGLTFPLSLLGRADEVIE
jgi:putative tryptophan/tyrosine transport system substrate-binding protein